jgi:hypothetical protein
MQNELPTIIKSLNDVDVFDLATNEFEGFERILDQVKEKPPSTPTLLKDHLKAHQHLIASSKAARNHLADEEFELFQADLQHLKTDLGHQYEPFFRLSQISKEWKATVGYECRRCIEKLMAYGEIWNSIGLIALPASVNEISAALEELKCAVASGSLVAKRHSARASVRDSASSTSCDRSNSVSAAAKSSHQTSVPRVFEAEPKPNQQTKAIKRPVRASSVRIPTPAGSVCESNVSISESPRLIARCGSARISAVGPSDDGAFLSDLRDFEVLVAKYNAGIMAKEHLKAFVNELKAMLKLRRREPHLTKLRTFLRQLDTEMVTSESGQQLDVQRFKAVRNTLENLIRELRESQKPEASRFLPDITDLAQSFGQLEEHHEKLACESVIALAEKLAAKVGGDPSDDASQKALFEMGVVQSRINALRAERTGATERYLQEIEAEIHALTTQQMSLIEQIGPFRTA